MLHEHDELTDEIVELELTLKGRQWVEDAETSARNYLRWLNSLIPGERIDLCREAKGDIHRIEAAVYANTATKVVVVILHDALLPSGARYEAGEPVVVSKDFDILFCGARRLAPLES